MERQRNKGQVDWCTPSMGVNLSALSLSAMSSRPNGSRPKSLWGVSPLYVNPVSVIVH